jgi:hypothetical protein
MKKRLLISLLLALGYGHAMAEWIKISTSEQSVFYMESPVSKKVGDNVMVWLLRDHTSPRHGDSGTYSSSKDQIEVDCRRLRIRRVYSSDHPQAMGQGNFVHSEHGPMSWNDATPNTIIKRIVDVACMTR